MTQKGWEVERKHILKQHIRGRLGKTACFDGVQHTARQKKILQKCEHHPSKTWHIKRQGSKRIRIAIRPFICPSVLPAFCLFGTCCVSLFLLQKEDLLPALLTGFQEARSCGLRAAHKTFTPVYFRALTPTFATGVLRRFVSNTSPGCNSPGVALPLFATPSYLCISQDWLL